MATWNWLPQSLRWSSRLSLSRRRLQVGTVLARQTSSSLDSGPLVAEKTSKILVNSWAFHGVFMGVLWDFSPSWNPVIHEIAMDYPNVMTAWPWLILGIRGFPPGDAIHHHTDHTDCRMKRYGKWKILKNTNQSKKLGQTIINNPDPAWIGSNFKPTATRLGGNPGPGGAPNRLQVAQLAWSVQSHRFPGRTTWEMAFNGEEIGYSSMFRVVKNLTEPYGRSLKKGWKVKDSNGGAATRVVPMTGCAQMWSFVDIAWCILQNADVANPQMGCSPWGKETWILVDVWHEKNDENAWFPQDFFSGYYHDSS